MARLDWKLAPESDLFLPMDFLRFIAATVIILYHFSGNLVTAPGQVLENGLSGHAIAFVDLFFILSGFIIAYVYGERLGSVGAYAAFLWKRVARLYPLHLATLAGFIALWLLADRLHVTLNDAQKYDASCILPNVLMLQAFGTCSYWSFNEVSWSISAEFGMYVLAPLLLWFGRRTPIVLGFITVGALVLLPLLPIYDHGFLQAGYDFGVLRALPAFSFGVLLFACRERLAAMPQPALLMWGGVAGMVVLPILWPAAPLWLVYAFAYVTALGATALQQRNPAFAGPASGKLAALGSLTYSSYMLHPLIQTVLLSFLLKRIVHVDGWMNDGVVLLAVVATFPLSYLSLVLFEQPVRRSLKKLLPRRKASPHPATAESLTGTAPVRA